MNKRIIAYTIILLLSVLLTGCNKVSEEKRISIISTSFPGYDFARAITKDSDNVSLKMLLKPGSEMHDYEPTPQDIINIRNSDIFIYVGGESDAWIDDIINDINPNRTKIIKLMDFVNLKLEEDVEGMEIEDSEKNYDEHVWTSPLNAIKIVNSLKDEIISIDESSKALYNQNALNYTNELEKIDTEISTIVMHAKRKELVFADRFPFRYLTDEYGLTYYAAFPGCSDQTEASAKTIAFLINKVKEENIPVVFQIELSNGNIAKTIAEETKVKVLVLNSAHNITEKDFKSGRTYVDIMKENTKYLREALN